MIFFLQEIWMWEGILYCKFSYDIHKINAVAVVILNEKTTTCISCHFYNSSSKHI